MTWKQEYFHACDALRKNGWNTNCERFDSEVSEVWYDISEDGRHIIMYTVYIHGITLRVDFYEENAGIVTVYSCWKCNDPGCVFTEPEYESVFWL